MILGDRDYNEELTAFGIKTQNAVRPDVTTSLSLFNLAVTPALEVPRLTIRPARVSDVPGIHEQIQMFADRGLMIRRSLAELYQSIREFLVAVDR